MSYYYCFGGFYFQQIYEYFSDKGPEFSRNAEAVDNISVHFSEDNIPRRD